MFALPAAGFLVLGAVFLALTGGEALYADMGHFGQRPIRIALVRPRASRRCCSTTSGQAAFVLANPAGDQEPVLPAWCPTWALLPMVVLATCATVIASQAVISGAFSVTRQAIQLGYVPRLKILHTSRTRDRPDLRAVRELDRSSSRWCCWCWASRARATSPTPTASRSRRRW